MVGPPPAAGSDDIPVENPLPSIVMPVVAFVLPSP
jgi:hypothetical protein